MCVASKTTEKGQPTHCWLSNQNSEQLKAFRCCLTSILINRRPALPSGYLFNVLAVCNQFSRGVFAMLGAVSPDSFDTLHSYSNTFQMPFVTPWFPEKVSSSTLFICHISFALAPSLAPHPPSRSIHSICRSESETLKKKIPRRRA